MDTVLFLLSKTLWMVVRPNTLALILACGGLALLWRRQRWGRWPALLGLGYYALVMLAPVAWLLTIPLEDRFPRPGEPPAHVDGVVVLGGAVDQRLTAARGIPALNGAAERMTEALALARRYPEARIVFTGGTAEIFPGEKTEADVARELWSALGLDPARALYEDRSRNTHENAVLTHALARPQPGETWLLVTSASHMPRAMGVFRAAGWSGIRAWPVNYSTGHGLRFWYEPPFPARLGQAEWAIREWIGMAAYWAMGRTSEFFPSP
jgi:uncharacterized SAM-binding protein YcdF (DUF218 family)